MRRSAWFGLAVVASATGFSACGDAGGSTGTSTSVANHTTVAPFDAADPYGLVLMDAGAEPRLPRRLAPTVGETQHLTVSQVTVVESNADGEPSTARTEIAIDVDITATAVSGDGIETDVVYVDVRVNGDGPADGSTVDDALSDVIDSLSTLTLDYRGNVTDVGQFDVPETGDEDFDSLLMTAQQYATFLTTPMPDEAIGLGASWTVAQVDPDETGATWTYTLLAVEGSRLTIERTLASAPDGDDDSSEVAFSGTGRASIDLTQVAPTGLSHAVTGSKTLSVSGFDYEQQFSQVIEVAPR